MIEVTFIGERAASFELRAASLWLFSNNDQRFQITSFSSQLVARSLKKQLAQLNPQNYNSYASNLKSLNVLFSVEVNDRTLASSSPKPLL